MCFYGLFSATFAFLPSLCGARACLSNTKRDDSPPRRRSKAKEKGKEPDTREERKKETIIQIDKRERKGERKKREQSDCERAAPHPGSRVSNRYHLSVGKNQSPGALLLLLVCVSVRLAILDCKHIATVASNVVINVLFSFFFLEPPPPPLLFCSRGLVCCLDFSVEN